MVGRVLVVGDDEVVLEVVGTVLDLEDLDVRTARDGPSVLDEIAHARPDVVVCDVMPGLDGFEVCSRIKADPATADTPVIVLSARDPGEDRDAGQAAGCDACLTKPFSPLMLIDVITEVVAGTVERG